MTTRILVIDDEVRSRVGKVVEFSSNRDNYYRPFRGVPPGDGFGHTVNINDFRCVFSITEASNPSNTITKLFRHLSISIPSAKPGKLPHPTLVQEIAVLFGFTGGTSEWKVALHGEPNKPSSIVVVIQDLPEVKTLH